MGFFFFLLSRIDLVCRSEGLFYALFRTERRSGEMALGGAALDRDALFQAANKAAH